MDVREWRSDLIAGKRFMSVGARLALGVVAVIALVSAVLFVELTERERRALVTTKVTAATMVTDVLTAGLAAPLDFADTDAIEHELAKLRSTHDVVYAAVWSNDHSKPLAELKLDPTQGPGRPEAAPYTNVQQNHVGIGRVIMSHKGVPLGVVIVRLSLAAENAAFAATRRRLFWISLAFAAGTAALLVALARRQIVRPLERLFQAARRIEMGERAYRVEVAANDEIGRVAVAFNAMREAIFDRERRLEAANQSVRELLDHMRQGIVVFDREGVVGEVHSAQARSLFGPDVSHRPPAYALMYPDLPAWDIEAQAFADWIPLAFEATEETWAEIVALAPTEVTIHRGEKDERLLGIEFRPIFEGGTCARVMLLASDETERRRLERVGAEYARQVDAMRRLMAGGAGVFVGFLDGARRRIARCTELIEQKWVLRGGELDELFQHFHTIKGEAATFELGELAERMRAVEQALAHYRSNRTTHLTNGQVAHVIDISSIHDDLMRALAEAAEDLNEAETRFVEASPIGRVALEQTTVLRTDVARLGQLLGKRSDELGTLARRMASRPFGESVAMLADKVPTWAQNDHKRARLEVRGREVLVPPELGSVLIGALVHLVRNAIAHGIETPSEREEKGKDALGLITISCIEQGDAPTVTVADDGRGISTDRSGLASAQRIFESGYSTASTDGELAGLGVGLTAVRSDLAKVGYDVTVSWRPGHGTQFELRSIGAESNSEINRRDGEEPCQSANASS